jgi:tetratricopeptide (TPR) repeat protein
VALAVAVAYQRAGSLGFVFDDAQYVITNGPVRDGLSWENVRWAFRSVHAANWHPLTWLTHMLDSDLFGFSPRGPHLVNVGLHVLSALLLLTLVRRLGGSLPLATAVAAVFALHPQRLESVAWISERKDLLASGLVLLTLLAWSSHLRRPGAGAYLAALSLHAAALMSKPMAVTTPLLMLILDWWPLGRLRGTARDRGEISPAAAVAEKAPFLLLSAASAVVTFLAQRAGGSVSALAELSPGPRILNASLSYLAYLRQFLWPHDLSVHYPHPGRHVSLAGGLAAWGLIILATLVLAHLSRRRPHLLGGWLLYLVALLPVIGFVQVGLQARADRYTYLPLVGVAVALLREAGGRPRLRPWLAGSLPVLLLALTLLTRRGTGYWRSDETLFRRALGVDPRNQVALTNLATLLSREGRTDDAFPLFLQAVLVSPDLELAHLNLAWALAERGRTTSGGTGFSLPLTVDGTRACLLEGRLWSAGDEAGEEANLGMALLLAGKTGEAEVRFRASLERDRHSPSAWNNLGCLLYLRGESGEAAAHFRRALTLRADHPSALANLPLAEGRGPGEGPP